MMEGSMSSPNSFRWLSHPKAEASTLLWKLKDCFSTAEPTDKENIAVDNRTPVMELKDVPLPVPPPHHQTSPGSFQPLSLASLPLPQLCLSPPSQVTQGSQQPPPPPQQQLREGSSSKVSNCTHCADCSAAGQRLLDDGGFVGSNSNNDGVLSAYIGPRPPGAPVNSIVIGSSVASSVHPYKTKLSSGSGGEALNPLLSLCYKPPLHSSIATSQPVSSYPKFLSCPGLCHTCPRVPLPCSQSGLFPTSAPLASSLASVSSGSCLASSGYTVCCSDCSSSATRLPRSSRGDHPTYTTMTSTTSAHFCFNPVHPHVDPTFCVKGEQYCQECCLKPNGLASESDKVLLANVPVPIPICNGCGSSSDSVIPVSRVGKTGRKYGCQENNGPENITPVGVFWDIENCSVPSGRSAGAVVQRIRSRFFQGHREAEFICVCDISKESKAVIQELNNCQVTVAHINATAKNAADDKLRQSLRRYAETHTAPATVVLVSSDVNFASELSDLRHRHGFQVILVHGNHTSPVLLQHAHRHVAFQEITTDLPPRMLVKVQPSFNLYVHNLPVNCDKSLRNAVKLRLRRLSDNCGGKVLGMSQGTAVLRFGSPETAARARKRMENEDVFGHRISLSFSPWPRARLSPVPQVVRQPHLLPQALAPPNESQDSVLPPFPSMSSSSCLEKPRSPRREAAHPCHKSGQMPERPYSPRRGTIGPPGGAPAKTHQEVGSVEVKPRVLFEMHNTAENCSKAGLTGESMYRRRQEGSTFCSVPGFPGDRGDRSSGAFQISTPSAFNKLNLPRRFSPLVLSQNSWSSRTVSPCRSRHPSPIPAAPCPCPEGQHEPFSEEAGVQVSNLDYRMSRKDLQQTLHEIFSRYGQVKGVELSPHTDYQLKASVQMLSLQEAITAVGPLHRYKIGGKRIQVSLTTGGNSKSPSLLSTEIVAILQDAPASCLPLSKLTEIYEKKYSCDLVVGDLYRLAEVVTVREQGGCRLVCLLPGSQIRRSPLGSSQSLEGSSATGSPVLLEEFESQEPVCKQHYQQQDFSEADFDPDSYKIPFVVTSLSTFVSEVHSLLQSHKGTLPLLSFPDCYAAHHSPLQLGSETLVGSVSLEHLISCVPSVTIVQAQNGFKVIKWIHNKQPTSYSEPWIQRCKSPVGNPQLIQFSREVIDLLKNQPCCVMPISKFIPSYHHHFAKQCRVSNYGYSKLLELLEAVPHILQILGMGTKRLLTLTHRAQVKRFTQDLLKLLKFQASKQVAIKDFMQAYHWCFSRDWRVVDYGVCDLMDLLTEIPDTTITLTQEATDTIISVPKRERTTEEMERTKQFAKEVIDLLRHQPHCRMPFSKFIPTYHHHFGRQCKLSYYGFNKLMDLFEAIPDVLMVLECGEEKVLNLTEVECIKALAAQLVKLLRTQRNSSLPVSQLLTEYSKTFGYGLRMQDYDASTLLALLTKLCHVVKVVEGREVQLINRKSLRSLTSQLLALLMSQEEEQVTKGMKVEDLSDHYLAVHGVLLNPCEYGFLSLTELVKSLPYLLELYHEEPGDRTTVSTCATGHGEEWVRLTRLYQFARSIRALLHTYHYNQIFLAEFPGAYHKFTGCSLDPRCYGYVSIDELLSAIPQVVWIKGHGHKRIVVLKNDMKVRTNSVVPNNPWPEADHKTTRDDTSSSSSPVSAAESPGVSGAAESELPCPSSPVDLLCDPVPSCVPSPQLHPNPVLTQMDLIHFEEKTRLSAESEEEDDVEAAGVTDPAEDCGTYEETAVAEPSPSPNTKSSISMDRRAARSRFKLAANFSCPTGI